MHSYDQMFHKINIYHLFQNVDKNVWGICHWCCITPTTHPNLIGGVQFISCSFKRKKKKEEKSNGLVCWSYQLSSSWLKMKWGREGEVLLFNPVFPRGPDHRKRFNSQSHPLSSHRPLAALILSLALSDAPPWLLCLRHIRLTCWRLF